MIFTLLSAHSQFVIISLEHVHAVLISDNILK